MLPNLRPSILHRHRKSASLGNQENSEREHQNDEVNPRGQCSTKVSDYFNFPRSTQRISRKGCTRILTIMEP